jgi:hypothetical protein
VGACNFEGYTLSDGLKAVGPGWSGLVRRAFDAAGEAKIIQVKEKFGMLRIYAQGSTKEFNELLSNLELDSMGICEICGEPGAICSPRSWTFTLCKDHEELAKTEYTKFLDELWSGR